ncbi:MAG: DUF2953 domain-containing protein [Thermaerobacter sp.]|nr:DUF2953 domain-containing protein [Thermaerobacter sp.]
MNWYLAAVLAGLLLGWYLPWSVRLTYRGGGGQNLLDICVAAGGLPLLRRRWDLGATPSRSSGGGLRRVRRVAVPFLRQVLPWLRCHRLVWHARVGLGDAAATGLGCGLGWAVMGGAVPWLRRRVRFAAGQPRLILVPSFGEPALDIFLDCILSASTGQLILAGGRALPGIFAGRGRA